MYKQFNLVEHRFDEPVITQDEEGQMIATTHGEGWLVVADEESYLGLLDTIAGGGEIWQEEGSLHYSGAMPTIYHIYDKAQRKWRLPNQEEREKERLHYLTVLKNAKLKEINDKAEAFVIKAAELDKTPKFEQITWQEQANEAIAWHADNNHPTPTLDTIAKNRNVPVELLRQKAYEKTVAFRHLANTIAGQRQHFEDLLKQADSPEAVEKIEVSYALEQAEQAGENQ